MTEFSEMGGGGGFVSHKVQTKNEFEKNEKKNGCTVHSQKRNKQQYFGEFDPS